MGGRNFVMPDDVKKLYATVLCHRIILGAEGRLGQRTVGQVVDEVVKLVPAPILDAQSLAPPPPGAPPAAGGGGLV